MTSVNVEIRDRVATIHMDSPPLNVLTTALQNQLREEFASLRQRDDHNVVMLQSALPGKFSSGADVNEHIRRDNVECMLQAAHGLIAEVLRCPVPTIACLNGDCFGGAFELALSCDQIVGISTARLGTPEIKLGCYPPAALVLMPMKLPPMLAYELVSRGSALTTRELGARGAGIQVVGADDFETTVIETAQSYANLPRGVLVEATRLMRAGASARFQSAIGPIEAAYLERLLKLPDATEGPRAFLEKRSPTWTHDGIA